MILSKPKEIHERKFKGFLRVHIPWLVDDLRRYLLVLNEPKIAMSRVDKRSAIKSSQGQTLAMTNDESEATDETLLWWKAIRHGRD